MGNIAQQCVWSYLGPARLDVANGSPYSGSIRVFKIHQDWEQSDKNNGSKRLWLS